MSAVETAAGKAQAMVRDSVKTVIAASMVGTAIEFYDFYAYGTAAANYFPKVFFGDTANPTVALLASLLTFAIAFIARPLGSLVFGHFGDRMGRKTTLVVSLLTMGIATFLIGCLPTYDQWGVVAVAVLCLCRFVQGIGLGGEWSGAALVATENAPEDKRALYGSFPELGAPIGFFLSNGTYFLLETFNDDQAMLSWGWRVPFLLSAVLVIVGLVVRVQMEETPIFRMAQEQKKVVKSPLTEVFRKSWKQVIQATFLVAVTYTLFYTLATWSLAWGTKSVEDGGGDLGFTNQEYLFMLMVAVCVFAAFIMISCVNADRFGRRRVIVISSCCLVAFALLFPFLLDSAVVGQRNFVANLAFLCIGVALMGIGQAMGFPEGWIAGAIISGAYFGDKLSLLSDTTVLASSTAGVEVFTHIRYTLYTTVPSMLIALGVFTVAGLALDHGDSTHAEMYAATLAATFRITPWLLAVPLATGMLIARKLPAIVTLFSSVVFACAAMLLAQPELVARVAGVGELDFMSGFKGVLMTCFGPTAIPTGAPQLDELVATRGMAGMLNTVWLIICAMCFGGVMTGSGMLRSLTSIFLRWVRRAFSAVASTVGAGLFFNLCTADQYISIILSGRLFRDLYADRGLEPRLLSRSVEDSATVCSVLIPWNSCGMTQATVLGVSTFVYAPYCIFNIVSPLMSLLVAAVGWNIKRKK